MPPPSSLISKRWPRSLAVSRCRPSADSVSELMKTSCLSLVDAELEVVSRPGIDEVVGEVLWKFALVLRRRAGRRLFAMHGRGHRNPFAGDDAPPLRQRARTWPG